MNKKQKQLEANVVERAFRYIELTTELTEILERADNLYNAAAEARIHLHNAVAALHNFKESKENKQP